ncbi:MAG: PEP-CTERM sorting domain-containing protein [Acidobacteria bacterium]|nr:PEP-CTERM sorting domain-containing protein [Acidobacteriota bacterium]
MGTCNGVLYTTGNTSLATYISAGFVYGERAPDQYATGWASNAPSGTDPLYTQIGNGIFNMQAGPVGPEDTAGGLAYNLGDLAPGDEAQFTFYKGLAEVPEPGTWATLAAGLLFVAAASRARKPAASHWTSSSSPKQIDTK